MRVTNQIITNKTLTNINNNKQRLVDIENQYQTGKKISRPSDNPVATDWKSGSPPTACLSSNGTHLQWDTN